MGYDEREISLILNVRWVGRMKCRQSNPTARYVVAFGLGLVLSSFCPAGLIMFIVAVILIALGIALIRC